MKERVKCILASMTNYNFSSESRKTIEKKIKNHMYINVRQRTVSIKLNLQLTVSVLLFGKNKEAYGTYTLTGFFSGTYIQFGFFPLILRPRFADIVV